LRGGGFISFKNLKENRLFVKVKGKKKVKRNTTEGGGVPKKVMSKKNDYKQQQHGIRKDRTCGTGPESIGGAALKSKTAEYSPSLKKKKYQRS